MCSTSDNTIHPTIKIQHLETLGFYGVIVLLIFGSVVSLFGKFRYGWKPREMGSVFLYIIATLDIALDTLFALHLFFNSIWLFIVLGSSIALTVSLTARVVFNNLNKIKSPDWRTWYQEKFRP
eukprot:UN06001